MNWKTIEFVDIEFAMKESDGLGLQQFREKYGFHPAHSRHMYFNGKGPYEARPLIAAAYSKKYPLQRELIPSDFVSSNAHIFLEEQFYFKSENFN